MHLIQVKIASSSANQPIIAPAVQPAAQNPFSVFIIQNNSASSVRVGDSTVSATKGIVLAAGGTTTTSPLVIAPALQFTGDLREFYLYGTADALIDILVFD